MKNLKPGSRRCLCPTCEESFNSVAAFDRHRVPVGVDGCRLARGHRRCLDPLEMLACGMVENAAGYWVTEPSQYWTVDK